MKVKVMNTSNSQKGFTLIEIAIVLVIIGLLLGGVLKGQELINTARVRAMNNTVDGITAAWFSFQDRYRSFPGDYSNAQSTVNLPGIPGAAIGPAGGNGNGLVGTDNERALVWVHLEAAGYLTGGYTNDAALVAATEYACPPTVCPDNGFGSGMNLSYGSLVQTGAANTHELVSGRGVPVEVIAELDRKVDDGSPNSGAMQLGIGGAGWTNADSGLCITGANNYELQNPSDNCAAVFRNF